MCVVACVCSNGLNIQTTHTRINTHTHTLINTHKKAHTHTYIIIVP
jgi:hypothetical protein